MEKWFIFMMCLLILFTITFSGCGSSIKKVKTKKLSNYSFFETENSEEYLKFLNELDRSSTQEI